MTVIGIGPCPVEDVLAVGVRLGVQRHGTHERLALPQREIVRRPTRTLASATCLMKRMEKFVAQEGIPGGKRVPRPRLDRPQRIDDFGRGRVFLQSIRSERALTVEIIGSNELSRRGTLTSGW